MQSWLFVRVSLAHGNFATDGVSCRAGRACRAAGRMARFGSGFYCGLLKVSFRVGPDCTTCPSFVTEDPNQRPELAPRFWANPVCVFVRAAGGAAAPLRDQRLLPEHEGPSDRTSISLVQVEFSMESCNLLKTT